MTAVTDIRPPIIWSIAGNDSGGGAGLSADQRAADACGVQLCPVVAAITAQNSVAVTRVASVDVGLLDAQLAALAADLPPAAIKTGLLGSADAVRCVARWVDTLRARGPVALVVDPVLASSTGACFADADTLAAYRTELLPRATLITPNRAEAALLLGQAAPGADDAAGLPALARALVAAGAEAVCITGGDSADVGAHILCGPNEYSAATTRVPALRLVIDWLHTPHAQGWLALPRVDTPHSHGTGCTFATSAAAALARGFVTADAVVLAKMATTHALRGGWPAGAGRGPVRASAGFATDPSLLPQMSWGEAPVFADPDDSAPIDGPPALPPVQVGTPASLPDAAAPDARAVPALYAIVDHADRLAPLLAAGVRTLQLRIKTPAAPDAAWWADLRAQLQHGIAQCHAAGATLYINDHWQLALDLGAAALHLGQEDLLALDEAGRAELRARQAQGLRLGISSHSLWELARARSMAPAYVACGPVWPTLTKAMPWVPQGLDNLAWWAHMAGGAGIPVVAIGGILTHDQATQAAGSGAAAVCLVRGLGADPGLTVPGWQAALAVGAAGVPLPVPAWPHPSL